MKPLRITASSRRLSPLLSGSLRRSAAKRRRHLLQAATQSHYLGPGLDEFDSQGLYIQADYNDVSRGSVLVPSGAGAQARWQRKWHSCRSCPLEKVRNKRRGYILCGGWELMAHHADAEDAGTASLPGLTASGRGWLLDLFSSGYTDAYSEADPEPGAYTWWPDGGRRRAATVHIVQATGQPSRRARIYDEKASPTTHRW